MNYGGEKHHGIMALVEGFLTPIQSRFVDEYIIDLNGYQAALRAGYSNSQAKAAGSNLLNNVNVSEAIQRKLDERQIRTGITADMIIRELAAIALSNVINYTITDEGLVDLVDGAPDTAFRAVKSIKRHMWFDDDGNKHVETELQLWDKMAALKALGAHYGMLTERHAHLVNGEITHRQVWEIGGREITF